MPATEQLEDAVQLLDTIRRTVTGNAPETVAACDAGIDAIRRTLAEQRTPAPPRRDHQPPVASPRHRIARDRAASVSDTQEKVHRGRRTARTTVGCATDRDQRTSTVMMKLGSSVVGIKLPR